MGGGVMVTRDDYGQYSKEPKDWTDAEWRLFELLEEIASDENEDKTISAYMADVLDLLRELCGREE
jgi:hypothetical protein